MGNGLSPEAAWRAVVAELVPLVGVSEAPSRWADMPALWVDGREIAHLGGDGWLDVRLTRRLISEHRAALRDNPSIELRRPGADWAKFRLDSDTDLAAGIGYCRLAVAGNRR